MENESSLKEMINNSLQQIREVITADTVVGKQIVTPGGTVIIPISKISVGIATGGLDLPGKQENPAKGFGGGGGTGVNVTPIGFLTITPDGNVQMLPLASEKTSPIEQVGAILNNTPAIVEKIKDIFTGKKADGDAEAVEKTAEELEKAYDEKLGNESAEPAEAVEAEAEEPAPELSEKEQKKLRKQEEKAAKKAEKEARKEAKKDELNEI